MSRYKQARISKLTTALLVFGSWCAAMQEFLLDEGRLRKRLAAAAAVNLLLSPFLLMFLVIYFFMKHAERFYHSPGMHNSCKAACVRTCVHCTLHTEMHAVGCCCILATC